MNLKETASLLGWKREQVEAAIVEGVETPQKKLRVKLAATKANTGFDIQEEDVDSFLAQFEAEEPGRYPPVAVRRELLVECGHQCAICESDAPLNFHHIIEWAELRHHDPKHMLAICGSCHDKIRIGQIDTKSQRQHKAKLTEIFAKLKKLEDAVGGIRPQNSNDWPTAVGEFALRNVEFAIVHTPADRPGREYVLPVANGCLVEENYVLTCSEALDLANDVAKYKRGSLVIFRGLARYYFQAEVVDSATGLVLCKITGKDEEHWKETIKTFEEQGVANDIGYWSPPEIKQPARWTVSPLLGQEVGFILASDSEDNMRQAELSNVEFGTSVISHFKLPKRGALKVFITSVFAGRIRQVGSAVFARDGTLLGIISGVEKYEYDAGRRAVVKTLLGFPKFTKPKLKPAA